MIWRLEPSLDRLILASEVAGQPDSVRQFIERYAYPYPHDPNYLVVAAELMILPLVFGLWQIAAIFTLLNAAVLAIRISAENRALGRST